MLTAFLLKTTITAYITADRTPQIRLQDHGNKARQSGACNLFLEQEQGEGHDDDSSAIVGKDGKADAIRA